MKDGGPAFPIYPRIEGSRSTEISNAIGMTLRDYFAAKAMVPLFEVTGSAIPTPDECVKASEICYMIADAMLKARQK